MTASAPDFDPTCDFCRIGAGQMSDAKIVCESERWVAFFPLNPATPGHTLVVPRMHVENLWQASPAVASELMNGVIQVGRALHGALAPEGLNLITSAGRTAEQTVFHLHLHVVPRWTRDGFGRIWPTDHRYEDADLDRVADRVRAACARVS